jgi:hypothetical protein
MVVSLMHAYDGSDAVMSRWDQELAGQLFRAGVSTAGPTSAMVIDLLASRT